jgi:hypothetical protein
MKGREDGKMQLQQKEITTIYSCLYFASFLPSPVLPPSLPFPSFLFLYIFNLGIQEIHLLLEPKTSLATFSSTLAQNSNLFLASSFTCKQLHELI